MRIQRLSGEDLPPPCGWAGTSAPAARRVSVRLAVQGTAVAPLYLPW